MFSSGTLVEKMGVNITAVLGVLLPVIPIHIQIPLDA